MASELIDTQNGIAWILASIGILRGDGQRPGDWDVGGTYLRYAYLINNDNTSWWSADKGVVIPDKTIYFITDWDSGYEHYSDYFEKDEADSKLAVLGTDETRYWYYDYGPPPDYEPSINDHIHYEAKLLDGGTIVYTATAITDIEELYVAGLDCGMVGPQAYLSLGMIQGKGGHIKVDRRVEVLRRVKIQESACTYDKRASYHLFYKRTSGWSPGSIHFDLSTPEQTQYTFETITNKVDKTADWDETGFYDPTLYRDWAERANPNGGYIYTKADSFEVTWTNAPEVPGEPDIWDHYMHCKFDINAYHRPSSEPAQPMYRAGDVIARITFTIVDVTT